MKFKHIALATALAVALSACTVVAPNPDEVSVLVDRPLLFGKGGVRDDDVRTGGTRTYTWFSTEAKNLSIKPVAENVKFDDFSSKDNTLLDFQTVLRYRVTNAPELVRLGDGWFANNVLPQYTDIVRREVKDFTMQELMSDQRKADELDARVTSAITKVVADQKLPVQVLGVNLGRARPDPTVLTQMNLTAAERQRSLTMQQADAAERARKEAETSRAAADNAYRLALGMSSDEFVKLEQAKLLVEACSKAKECVLVPQGTAVVR